MPAALKSICPVFSTLDVAALLDHYRTLGFTTSCHSDPSTLPGQVEYGFAERDGIVIHIALNPEHDPATTAGCCFVHVSDADALAAEWRATAGRNVEPVNTTYNMREGGHVDPDGNLIRYGSRTT
ncbi:uncharacterized protein EHS24_000384 [Apiotrichum porosum]|uniref:VOC domain-containing protein n=1 Tax=Apiotrichum porosum TaxID=105984 RepID=A0A427Y9V9_9TREE|nr:uncharacterized protein EHS24_000384 [Apiotrichum porosum]RSH87866.1 hypothetical protein EHS24_000384 [Apiotrichum porosum]